MYFIYKFKTIRTFNDYSGVLGVINRKLSMKRAYLGFVIRILPVLFEKIINKGSEVHDDLFLREKIRIVNFWSFYTLFFALPGWYFVDGFKWEMVLMLISHGLAWVLSSKGKVHIATWAFVIAFFSTTTMSILNENMEKGSTLMFMSNTYVLIATFFTKKNDRFITITAFVVWHLVVQKNLGSSTELILGQGMNLLTSVFFLHMTVDRERKLLFEKERKVHYMQSVVSLEAKFRENLLSSLDSAKAEEDPRRRIQSIIMELKSNESLGNLKFDRAAVDHPILTKREAEIHRYLETGVTIKDLAQILGTTENNLYTVKSRIKKKLSSTT